MNRPISTLSTLRCCGRFDQILLVGRLVERSIRRVSVCCSASAEMNEKYKNRCIFIRSPCINNENERKCMEMNVQSLEFRYWNTLIQIE